MILCFFIFLLGAFYVQLQPVFQIQAQAYFHEQVVSEIMNSIKEITVPDEFVVKSDNQVSINANVLNKWIVEVNEKLNESIPDVYEASIPLGYFTGVVFF